MRKWTRAVPTIAAFVVSAAAFNKVPEVASVDLTPLVPPGIALGEGAVSRVAVLLLMPVVSLAVLILFSVLEKVRGPAKAVPSWWLNDQTGAAGVQRFEPTYNAVVAAVTGLVALMHVVLVGSALGSPDWAYQVFTAVFGFGIMAAGNVMPRVRPNWIVGIRTPRTLSDPAAWSKTHRVLGTLLLTVGGIIVVLSLIAPRYALVSGLVALLIALALAHVIGTRHSGAASTLA